MAKKRKSGSSKSSSKNHYLFNMKVSPQTAKIIMIIGIIGFIWTAIGLIFDVYGLVIALGYASLVGQAQTEFFETFGIFYPGFSSVGVILMNAIIWVIVHILMLFLFMYLIRIGKPRKKGKF